MSSACGVLCSNKASLPSLLPYFSHSRASPTWGGEETLGIIYCRDTTLLLQYLKLEHLGINNIDFGHCPVFGGKGLNDTYVGFVTVGLNSATLNIDSLWKVYMTMEVL